MRRKGSVISDGWDGDLASRDERLVNDGFFDQVGFANEGHLEYMTDEWINDETVEKFGYVSGCVFAHLFMDWPEREMF